MIEFVITQLRKLSSLAKLVKWMAPLGNVTNVETYNFGRNQVQPNYTFEVPKHQPLIYATQCPQLQVTPTTNLLSTKYMYFYCMLSYSHTWQVEAKHPCSYQLRSRRCSVVAAQTIYFDRLWKSATLEMIEFGKTQLRKLSSLEWIQIGKVDGPSWPPY